MLRCVKDTLRNAGQKFNKQLYPSTFIYAQKYVDQFGTIPRETVLTVLLMSAIVAVKFWVDVGDVDMRQIAHLAGVSRDHILRLERKFLRALDYNLFIKPSEIPECLHVTAC
jgi:hypothetical protein